MAIVTSGVLVAAAAGLVVLWLSTRATDPPTPAVATEERPAPEPPPRLDRLPSPRAPAATGPAEVGGGGQTENADGARSGSAPASQADIKRELTALAGENAAIVAALRGDQGPGAGTGEIVEPLDGYTLARFGRGLIGRLHAGVDIGVPSGTPVHAADAGEVVISATTGAYGKYLCIKHTGTLSTCYGHNSRLEAEKGESVDSGEVIAQSGCSGRCYDDHLHFEVRVNGRAVNPRDYL